MMKMMMILKTTGKKLQEWMMRITVMTLQECRKDKMTTQTSVKREEKERSQRTMCNSIKKQSMQL